MLKAVDSAEFFRLLYADPRDIMPSCERDDRTEWRDKQRNLFGVTRPGWRNPGGAKTYEVVVPDA